MLSFCEPRSYDMVLQIQKVFDKKRLYVNDLRQKTHQKTRQKSLSILENDRNARSIYKFLGINFPGMPIISAYQHYKNHALEISLQFGPINDD